MDRYSVIDNKARREIVLLRGSGCNYRACPFCDYHSDCCADEDANYALNSEVLAKVTGEFSDLEVINSGSVFELDDRTLALIKDICARKGIRTLHFESHYMYKDRIAALREYFCGVTLKLKLGVETFDYEMRERVFNKGIPDRDPAVIADRFDEANFLFGVSGQTAASMARDIELGLKNFERICVNIMCANSTQIKPNQTVIAEFMTKVYPLYKDDARVDILINNTDFGVGE